jgi:hypothetical protein
MGAFKGVKSGIFGKLFTAMKQKQAASQPAEQAKAQAPQGRAERAQPFLVRRRGQAANILAGEQGQQSQQKRLLGE